MPCKARMARKLLRDKKAKVVRREPFTIQLLYGSSGYKQDISLGIDAGSKHIGTSATTSTVRILTWHSTNSVTVTTTTAKQSRLSRIR